MEKVPTNIEITDDAPAWGKVTVFNEDGSVNRQLRISGTEQDAINKGLKNFPDACTEKEWDIGIITESRPCNPGQGFVNIDGTLVVNYGVADNSIESKRIRIPKSQWSVEGDVVSVDSTVNEAHNISK